VVLGLALAVVLDTFVQLAWKTAAQAAPAADPVRGLLASPWFWAAMAGFAAQLANWLGVLARADLSFAQPITALSYVTVLALSRLWLHEPVGPARAAGVGLILLGVLFVSRT